MIALNANKSYHFLLILCCDYHASLNLVLALQCIESLKTHFQSAKISFLTHSSTQDFLKNNPFLDTIICVDKVSKLALEIKRMNIDIAIWLTTDTTSMMAVFRAGVKTRIGIFSKLHSFLLNYKIKQQRSKALKHETQYNLDLLKPLGCNSFIYPKIYLNISEKQESQFYLENLFGTHALLDSGFIAVCPSAGLHASWSVKNFFFLANELVQNHNILIVALPQEIETYKRLLANYEHLSQKNLFMLSPTQKSTSALRFMLGIISHAKLFIGNNTNLLHAASTLDVEVFALLPYKDSISPMRYAPIHKTKKHKIMTPFGIFNAKAPLQQHDEKLGLWLDSITPQFLLEVLYKTSLTI